MLTGLRVQNFKAWKDSGEVRLAPITVFFGANSSGKTSLHQLLLMLKQTAQSPDRLRVLHPGDDKTLVDLGTVQDLIHGHDLATSLCFAIEWQPREHLEVMDPRTGLLLEAEVAPANGKAPSPYVPRLSYRLGDPASGGLVVQMTPSEQEKGKYDLTAEGYDLVRQPGRVWALPPPIRFYGFPDEARVYFQNTDFVADLALSLERLLGALHYVGPLREYPRRSYTCSGEQPDHVGTRGDRAVEALLAASERRFNLRPKQKRDSFPELVARYLLDMGLVDRFRTQRIAEHRKEYEVLVQTTGSRHEVNLTDVGFGVSQVLPVLVECFYVPPGSTILFEQPEIHLHPSVQSALADLFVNAIKFREGGVHRDIQIIVESHSEHFLRRLQRRIAEGELDRDTAALYFCEPGPDGARLRALDVDPFGRISNWPTGFFGDLTGEVEAQTRAMLSQRVDPKEEARE